MSSKIPQIYMPVKVCLDEMSGKHILVQYSFCSSVYAFIVGEFYSLMDQY